MLKLVNENKDSVPIAEMRDGDVAVIMEWGAPHHKGNIVQRHGKKLICLGMSEGHSWGNLLTSLKSCSGNRVRILEAGETLIVEEN